MVKILSEKYSCFMTRRIKAPNAVQFTCRDGRRVVFWKNRGSDWVRLHARQFDADGYEIIVRQHRIVRVGTQRVL